MPSDPHTTELSILNYISDHADATQRDISQHVGLSVGAINFLLKKMVKKGLIKIEHLRPNSAKYFITPAGIASKIERTYGYIVRTYNEINRLRDRIVMVANVVAKTSNAKHIIFFGKKDDLYELIVDLHKLKSFAVSTSLCSNTEQLEDVLQKKSESIVIVWNQESEESLEQENYKYINIMRMLVI